MVLQRRGTRPCPFCGERIKSVAIRCRFCHADIEPLVAPETEPEVEAEDPPGRQRTESAAASVGATEDAGRQQTESEVGSEATEDDGEEASRQQTESAVGSEATVDAPDESTLSRSALTNVLIAALVIGALVVAGLGWRAWDKPETVEAGGASLTESDRTELLVTAADLAQRTLSYHYDSFEQDRETATARMTDDFRTDYDDTMDQVEANTIENQISLQAVAVASGIITATDDRAEVLVFANQTTTAEKNDNTQLNRSSLIITLERDGDDWLLSDLQAVR